MVKKKNLKIIFTHLKPDIWQYKVASTLRNKQVKTVSISLLAFDRKMFKNAFDEIICLDLPNLKLKTIFCRFFKNPLNFFKFFYKIFNIKADAAIIQGPPLYLTSFFIKIFKNKFPRIFFSYDVLSAIYKNQKENMSKEQIWGEKYSFKNCDAILDKNSIEELRLLPESFEVYKKPIIEFSSYPLSKWFVDYEPEKKLSYKKKEIHIVYVGFVVDNSLLSFFEDIKQILKQKMHMHIYANDKLSKNDISKLTGNKKELEYYLHIYPYIHPEKLSSEISKYDFGFHFFEYLKGSKPAASQYALGNKRSSYFEALIPIVVQKGCLFASTPVNKEYLGLTLINLKNLKTEIRKFDYKKSRSNIEKFREKTSVKENINRIIEFIEKQK